MDWRKVFQKVLENWRIVFEGIMILILSFFIYSYFTKPTEVIDTKAIIQKIEEKRAQDYQVLENIEKSIDSLHVEQRYTIEKIDGTQNTIKKLEKQRYEKITYYTSSPDSTVSFLRNRYNKVKLSKDSLSK